MREIKNQLIFLFLITSLLISCSNENQYTKKENLNTILNQFEKGEYYSCNFLNTIGAKDSNKVQNYSPNKNLTLIFAGEKIGLIYKNDYWNNRNTIFVKSKKEGNQYFLGSFYSKNDFDDKIINQDYKLKFDKKNLLINLYDHNLSSLYNCKQVKNILSEAMKKKLLENFLFQNNSDRNL